MMRQMILFVVVALCLLSTNGVDGRRDDPNQDRVFDEFLENLQDLQFDAKFGVKRGFGMTAELAQKKEEKFDAELANDALQWIKSVLVHAGRTDAANRINVVTSSGEVSTILKDGKILGYLANAIKPNSYKISSGSIFFQQMENIGHFLDFCEKLGVSKADLFQVVDLYEAQNIPQVINGIIALGLKAQKISGYDGPVLGPKESSERLREFSQKLPAGGGVIGLQMGSNKGASQAG